LGRGRYGIVVVSGSVEVVVGSVVVVASVVVVVASVVVVVGAVVVVVVVEVVVVVPGLVVVVAGGRVVVVVPAGGWVVGLAPAGIVVGVVGPAGTGDGVVPGPAVPLRGGRPTTPGSVVVVGSAGVSTVVVVPIMLLVDSATGGVVPGAARISSGSLGSHSLIGRRSGSTRSPTAAAST
jgi:hypothetical protein